MKLIDADLLIDQQLARCKHRQDDLDKDEAMSIAAAVQAAPTVDAVPVIRCKGCKYHEDTEHPGVIVCRPNGMEHSEGFYCAHGEVDA